MNGFGLLKSFITVHRTAIGIGLLCLLSVDILQLIIPRIFKQAIDDLTGLRCHSSDLLGYALQILGIALAIGLLRFIWRHCLMGTARKVEEGMRNLLFSHIQTLSVAFFQHTRTGDLMAHATNDLYQIRMAVGMGLVALMDGAVLGAATIGFMLAISPGLTLRVVLPMPFIIISTRFFSKHMHRIYHRVQGIFSEITETVRERLAGIRIIKAYNLQQTSIHAVAKVSQTYVSENMTLVRYTAAFFPSMIFFSNVSLAIILYAGGQGAIFGTITAGDFVAFINYLFLLTWPMMAMGWLINLVQRGKASLDRLNTILSTAPEIKDPLSPKPLPDVRPEIVFHRVRFAYLAAGPPVLNDLSFHIPTGKTVGIVGPPGSGKTSLLQLVPRLFDVAEGSISVNGIDIREVSLETLRKHIAYVPQEPFLFAGTIRDNITLGDPDMNESDLIRAASEAALYETVLSFPGGFDTVVGERGIMLSGGQKQRIGLARALLFRRPLLLLDDPLSQVDAETGNRIIRTLKSLSGRHTLMIVSHRIAAVSFADHILVLDQGRIAESGTHDALLDAGGYYTRAFRFQELEAR